jgi:hypothetical protein
MLSKGPVLVEYLGKANNIKQQHRGARGVLTFAPDPQYNGRRVVRFDSEENAITFINRMNYPNKGIFALAEDLILAEDQAAVKKVVEEVVAPLFEAIERIEAQLADRPAARSRKKKPLEPPSEG